MAIQIELGKKRAPQEAKAIVDELYRSVRERWEARVNQTPFMQQLVAGKLPMKVLQTFFRNWGGYTIEINTLAACTYHKHLTFFKKHRDLMAPLGKRRLILPPTWRPIWRSMRKALWVMGALIAWRYSVSWKPVWLTSGRLTASNTAR